MRRWLAGFLAMAVSGFAAPDAVPSADGTMVLVVVGAAGEAEYGEAFGKAADHWEKAAEQAGAKHLAIGRADPGKGSKDALRAQKRKDIQSWQKGKGRSQ